MRVALVLDALNMATWTRRCSSLDGLICHNEAGSQYTSITYTERPTEIGAAPSIGTVGDSFDNAMAGPVQRALQDRAVAQPRGARPQRRAVARPRCPRPDTLPKSKTSTVANLSQKRHEKPNQTSLYQTQAESSNAVATREVSVSFESKFVVAVGPETRSASPTGRCRITHHRGLDLRFRESRGGTTRRRRGTRTVTPRAFRSAEFTVAA
jgi:hypothetical protein